MDQNNSQHKLDAFLNIQFVLHEEMVAFLLKTLAMRQSRSLLHKEATSKNNRAHLVAQVPTSIKDDYLEVFLVRFGLCTLSYEEAN